MLPAAVLPGEYLGRSCQPTPDGQTLFSAAESSAVSWGPPPRAEGNEQSW